MRREGLRLKMRGWGLRVWCLVVVCVIAGAEGQGAAGQSSPAVQAALKKWMDAQAKLVRDRARLSQIQQVVLIDRSEVANDIHELEDPPAAGGAGKEETMRKGKEDTMKLLHEFPLLHSIKKQVSLDEVEVKVAEEEYRRALMGQGPRGAAAHKAPSHSPTPATIPDRPPFTKPLDIVVWLEKPEGQKWLRTEKGLDWLESPEGYAWLLTPEGCDWVFSPSGEEYFKTDWGRRFLASQTGRSWLETECGKKFLQQSQPWSGSVDRLQDAAFACIVAVMVFGGFSLIFSDKGFDDWLRRTMSVKAES